MFSVSTTSSSVYLTNGPNKTIDGNPSMDFDTCNCCFASSGHDIPWLLLDLNAKYSVARIVIAGRTDGNCHNTLY